MIPLGVGLLAAAVLVWAVLATTALGLCAAAGRSIDALDDDTDGD